MGGRYDLAVNAASTGGGVTGMRRGQRPAQPSRKVSSQPDAPPGAPKTIARREVRIGIARVLTLAAFTDPNGQVDVHVAVVSNGATVARTWFRATHLSDVAEALRSLHGELK